MDAIADSIADSAVVYDPAKAEEFFARQATPRTAKASGARTGSVWLRSCSVQLRLHRKHEGCPGRCRPADDRRRGRAVPAALRRGAATRPCWPATGISMRRRPSAPARSTRTWSSSTASSMCRWASRRRGTSATRSAIRILSTMPIVDEMLVALGENADEATLVDIFDHGHGDLVRRPAGDAADPGAGAGALQLHLLGRLAQTPRIRG